MDLAKNRETVKLQYVSGIVRLEFPDVADPPDVVSLSIVTAILPVHFPSGNLLAHGNGLKHGAVGKSAAAYVVDLSRSRRLKEPIEGTHQISAMEIIADLFAFVAKYGVAGPSNVAFHQVGKKAVKLRA